MKDFLLPIFILSSSGLIFGQQSERVPSLIVDGSLNPASISTELALNHLLSQYSVFDQRDRREGGTSRWTSLILADLAPPVLSRGVVASYLKLYAERLHALEEELRASRVSGAGRPLTEIESERKAIVALCLERLEIEVGAEAAGAVRRHLDSMKRSIRVYRAK